MFIPNATANLVILLIVLFLRMGQAAETNSEHLRLAFSSDLFTEVNENDARASVKVWGLTVTQERHIPVEPETMIFRDTASFRKALLNEEVDAVGITMLEYKALYQEVPFDPIFATYNAGQATVQYVLLVHEDSHFGDLADLRGRSISLEANPRSCLVRPWLDTILAQHGLKRTEQFFGKITADAKISKVLLPVFFHQCDACVVTRSGFETMAELNPQVARQLKAVATSPVVVPVLFCFRANYAPSFKENLMTGVRELHTTPAGLQVLTVFQSERTEIEPAGFLDGTLEFLALHDRVCGATNTSTGAGRDGIAGNGAQGSSIPHQRQQTP
jgi:phosphonate transport system substrate-binding protein